MKIEFVHEYNEIAGQDTWFTAKDGRFVSGSLKFDQEVAYEVFNRIVEEEKEHKERKVLKTVEI